MNVNIYVMLYLRMYLLSLSLFSIKSISILGTFISKKMYIYLYLLLYEKGSTVLTST